MAEFTSTARLLAALVVVIVSIVVWRLLQGPATAASKSTNSDKKKPKKKPHKKKKKATEPTAVPTQDDSASGEQRATEQVRSEPVVESEDDSNDEDAGLTAKQILAKRRFKPKAIGGRAVATTAATSVDRFLAGQRVVARFRDGRDWFPGVVLEVRRGNEYHIQYDDGEVEHHVPYARIQDEAAAAAKAKAIAEGATLPPSKLDPRLTLDSGRSEADDEANNSASEEERGDVGGDESDDGWTVVDKKRRPTGAGGAGGGGGASAAAEKVDADGLTKRQRESRRKKERKKEVKEMVRAQAQEQGLHARWGGTMTRLKYVPPPSQPSS